jgi:hypothetical protein
MSKQLMEVVLPRLARRLYGQLRRYRAGELNDSQFTEAFEELLQRQHSWLASKGVPDARAAIAIHGAVLVLSGPGLRAEASQSHLPLEVIEYRAVRAAAADIARNYEEDESKVIHHISAIVARYAD